MIIYLENTLNFLVNQKETKDSTMELVNSGVICETKDEVKYLKLK